ncbi:MAG: O-antigen ligase family protein [Candidatus Nomurabacteria bacterium]|jgi:hypothetical protein|nr:O-antigen ligase family protein [Candidatus Nomurabacteria bacterium]
MAQDKQALTIPRFFNISLLAILLAMPIWPFLSTWLGSFGGLLWLKSLPTLALAALMVAGLIYLAVNRRDVLKTIFKSRLVQFIALFAVVVLVSVVLSAAGEGPKLAAVAMDLRYFLAFIMAYALVQLDKSFWQSVIGKLPKVAIAVGVVLSLVGLAQVALLPPDFLAYFGYGADTIAPYITIDQTNVLRAFATLRGPNDYAAFLILPLLFAVLRLFSSRKLIQVLPVLVVAAGILASSSRSAILAALIALGVLAIVKVPKAIFKTKRFWAAAAVLLVMLAAGLALALNNPFLRLHLLHIRDGRDTATATSNSDHVDYAQDSVERIVRQPLGCGAGCSGPASYYGDDAKVSENYYLQITEEYGVVGLALWLTAVMLLASRLWRRRHDDIYLVWLAALSGYLFIGLLLHVFVDEPLTVVWFMIAGALVSLVALKPTRKSVKIEP